MSEHEVLVVKVETIYPHPDPETTALEIVKVWDYEFVTRLNEYKVGDLAILVEPDYVVPTTHPSFKFLDQKLNEKPHRVTTKRLRGVWSQGLLVKALEGHTEGQNVMDELGIVRWEPPPQKNGGWGETDLDSGMMDSEPVIPSCVSIPKYGLENFKKMNYSTKITYKIGDIRDSSEFSNDELQKMLSDGIIEFIDE